MHVLHGAVLEVAAGVQAQQLGHLAVPQRRDVLHLGVALDQGALDVEAQQDVGGVGHLVGIHADQSRLHARQQPVQVAGLEGRLAAEVPDQQRRQQAGEGRVAAQLHLEGQALALVDAHGAGARDGLAQQLARQVLLVAGVAGLMDDAHQRRQEVVFAVARGHAYVFRHAAAERVGALVQPAGAEVEAHQRHRVQAQRLLRRSREGADRLDDRLGGLPRQHVADQPRQPLAQRREGALHLGRAHARLVLVQQRVVLGEPRVLRQQLRLLARDGQHLAQVGREAGPVVGRALRAPGVFAAVVGQALGLHQRLRQRVGGAPGAADLAQVGALRVVQRLGGGGVQQAGQGGVGGQLVQQAVHLGQRQAARLVTLGGHVGGLVPLGDGLQMRQPVQALLAGGEVLVGGGGGVHCNQDSGMSHNSAAV